jgi:UPF0716 family protein affecting phage T7 exclusion
MSKTQVLAYPCSRAIVQTKMRRQRSQSKDVQTQNINKGSNEVDQRDGEITKTQRQRSKPLDAFLWA